MDKFKTFARENVYPCEQTLKLEARGRRVISDLMDFFWMGTRNSGPTGPGKDRRTMARRAFGLISANYKRAFVLAANNCPPEMLPYLRLQLVTDQVCGMTDGYACRMHQDLYGG